MGFEPKMPRSDSTPPPLSPSSGHLPVTSVSVDSLPSRGFPYKSASISYRPYTFGEIKKISQSKLGPKETINEVMNGIESSIQPSLLTLSDFLYISLLRRISTLGSTKLSVKCGCPKCGEDSTHILDSSSDFEFDDIKAPDLPVVVTFGGLELKFSPITVGGYLDLIEKGLEKDEMAIFAKQCINQEYDTVYNTLFNLPVSEAEVFNEIDSYMYHGLKPIEKNCKSCNHKIKIELDGGQALILPFREHREPVASRIRFGS